MLNVFQFQVNSDAFSRFNEFYRKIHPYTTFRTLKTHIMKPRNYYRPVKLNEQVVVRATDFGFN